MSGQNLLVSEGILVLFSITDKNSFSDLKEILDKILRTKDIDTFEHFPIILVANKIDLESERKVSIEEARKFAIENAIELIETSSKTRENVDQLFLKLIKKIKIFKNERYFFAGKESIKFSNWKLTQQIVRFLQ